MLDEALDRERKPHSRSLREWRQDIAHCTYFVRSCTWRREPLLAGDVAAQILFDTLRHAEDEGWISTLGYVIMPDHWHALWKLGGAKALAGVMQSVKRWSARHINKHLERSGAVWQDQYYEHLARDQSELEDCASYIAMNPVRTGLVARPGEYRWCSVDGLGQGDSSRGPTA